MKFTVHYWIWDTLIVYVDDPVRDPEIVRVALAAIFRVPLDQVDWRGEPFPTKFYVFLAPVPRFESADA